MFAVGTKNLTLRAQASVHDEPEERVCLQFLRSCFAAPHLEQQILADLPGVDDMPPPLLPPGWEQRLDEKAATIFYVDHSTCAQRVTLWGVDSLRAPTWYKRM
eukprot:663245-Pleurochrysis_carterae.AAC.1